MLGAEKPPSLGNIALKLLFQIQIGKSSILFMEEQYSKNQPFLRHYRARVWSLKVLAFVHSDDSRH